MDIKEAKMTVRRKRVVTKKVIIPPQRPLLNLQPHPSGRPIKEDRYVRFSLPRVPWDQPLTPSLRRGTRTEAIGFHHSYSEIEELEDFDDKIS